MNPSAHLIQLARNGRLISLALIMLITAATSGPASFAQTAPAEGEAGRKFSIGYLPEGSDIPNANPRMEELRHFLLAGKETRAALSDAGFSDVVLSPCDGPNDMVQRLAAGEFDLVFATATAYARAAGAAYEPVLQLLKLPGDFQPPGRDSGVLRRGVIFVGPRSPLFKQAAEPTREDLRRLLQRSPLAVPSADSAVGYLSPRYIMAHDLGLQTFPTPLFCGSDSEVVKHVASGLVEVGACSAGALERLLPAGRTADFVRIVRKTDPVPTDPILLRASLTPQRSALGIKLKAALRDQFFNNSVANASPRDFEMIVRYLQELKETPAAAQPAAPGAAPAKQPQPTPTPTPTPTPEATPGAQPTPTPNAQKTADPAPLTGAPHPALPRFTPPAPTPAARPALPPAAPLRLPGAQAETDYNSTETRYNAAPAAAPQRGLAESKPALPPAKPTPPPRRKFKKRPSAPARPTPAAGAAQAPAPPAPAATPSPAPRPDERPLPAVPPLHPGASALASRDVRSAR